MIRDDDALVSKELKKKTIELIKSKVSDKILRKDVISRVKDLVDNRPEKDLAYLLLDKQLVNIYIRIFEGDSSYFEDWLYEKFKIRVVLSETQKLGNGNTEANYMIRLFHNEVDTYLEEIEAEQNEINRRLKFWEPKF